MLVLFEVLEVLLSRVSGANHLWPKLDFRYCCVHQHEIQRVCRWLVPKFIFKIESMESQRRITLWHLLMI